MTSKSYLLDTHVWIWSQSEPERIGATARTRMQDREAKLFVSTISTLEIARLQAAGIIELKTPLNDWVRKTLDVLRCDTIEISHDIAIGAYMLPGDFHKDPADRLIAATAKKSGLVLLTADRRLLDYRHIKTLNASK